VSIPAVTPVTVSPETVAVALLLLHTPPTTASANVIDEPVHTIVAPVIVPEFGMAFTVIACIAVDTGPHPLTTE
jgi:hypothetical protein